MLLTNKILVSFVSPDVCAIRAEGARSIDFSQGAFCFTWPATTCSWRWIMTCAPCRIRSKSPEGRTSTEHGPRPQALWIHLKGQDSAKALREMANKR